MSIFSLNFQETQSWTIIITQTVVGTPPPQSMLVLR